MSVMRYPMALAVFALLCGCPRTTSPCVAGQEIACPCAGTTSTGVQICVSDGSGFGSCSGCGGGGGTGGGGGSAGGGTGGGSGGGTAGGGGGSAGSLQVALVAEACDANLAPFSGVNFLRVRILAADLTPPPETTTSTDGGSVTLLSVTVPPGSHRVVEVRGYDTDPQSGGTTLSMGRSVPIDSSQLQVNVFLRKVGALTPVFSASAPTSCQNPLQAQRAGHTATVLGDGRVFLAGGYNFMGGTSAKEALFSTEIYDPATGAFQTSHEISIANGVQRLPRAFQSATLLLSGQVLLWGGETYSGGVSNVVAPSAIILIYDPQEDNFGPLQTRQSPPVIPRTQHVAAIDASGRVLIAGGKTRDLSSNLVLSDQLEWFEPSTNLYQVVSGVSLPRDGASASAVLDGGVIAIAGGSDGATLQTGVSYFASSDAGFAPFAGLPAAQLTSGRRSAATVALGASRTLFFSGGYSDPSMVVAKSTSEALDVGSGTVTAGPTVGARGEACAVALETGDAFIGGGRGVDGSNASQAVDTVVLVHTGPSGMTSLAGPMLAVPRYQHTCSALQDGTVLVTGGLNEQSGVFTVLQDAYVYQPAPVD